MSVPVRVRPGIKAHVVTSGRVLGDGHPMAEAACPVCDQPLGAEPCSIVYVGRYPDDRDGWTAAGVVVHDGCTDGEAPDAA